jgi:hypothetical protein
MRPEADSTGGPPGAPGATDGATCQQLGAVLESRRQWRSPAERAAREQGLPLPDADQVMPTAAPYWDELDGAAHLGGLALVWLRRAAR